MNTIPTASESLAQYVANTRRLIPDLRELSAEELDTIADFWKRAQRCDAAAHYITLNRTK